MSEEAPRVHPADRAAWRAWLQANHEAAASVWLATWRKASGKPILGYDDAVSEALAFGWVDSKGGKIDDDRTMLYFARRKRGNAWSGPNRLRIERMRAAGLMHPAGGAVIAAAIADGSWALLDDVERLIVPSDLAAAFEDFAGARDRRDAFPRSARRGILEWIVQAKTPATRAKRVLETATRAARRAIGRVTKSGPIRSNALNSGRSDRFRALHPLFVTHAYIRRSSLVGATARIPRTRAMTASPIQPRPVRRSPTISTASTVAIAGSVRVIVVAVLADTFVSP